MSAPTDSTTATEPATPPGATTLDPDELDDTRIEEVEGRLVDVLNHGALALMISLGHRTGLFDTLAQLGPTTIEELAAAAGLHERYVTEWLGAMTVGAIVDHDPQAGTYHLPPEQALLLSRTTPGENLAVFAQYLPLLGAVEDDMVECFRYGGGLHYDAFPRFHEIMEEDSAQTVRTALREHILPLVPGLVDRLERGIRVADVGCGRGKALADLAAAFPNSTFTGYDLSPEAIEHARTDASARGLTNVTYHVQDATDLDEVVAPGSVEFITTFDAVHDQADPEACLRAIRRGLTDDGVYLAQDIDGTSSHHGDRDHPLGPLLYTLSCLHCMTVSLARGGEGLGAMWGRERALALFDRVGFAEVEVHTLEHDVQNAYYVCRP